MKTIFVALAVVAVIALPMGTHAQTNEERNALIATLLQQIAVLTEQLNALAEAEAEKENDDQRCEIATEGHSDAVSELREYEAEGARLDALLGAESGSDRLYTRLSVQLQKDRKAEYERLQRAVGSRSAVLAESCA